MQDEAAKALELKNTWTDVQAHLLANDELLPPVVCEYCMAMDEDAASDRPWAKCKSCKFQEACFKYIRIKAELDRDEIDLSEFKTQFATCIDMMNSIYTENYG